MNIFTHYLFFFLTLPLHHYYPCSSQYTQRYINTHPVCCAINDLLNWERWKLSLFWSQVWLSNTAGSPVFKVTIPLFSTVAETLIKTTHHLHTHDPRLSWWTLALHRSNCSGISQSIAGSELRSTRLGSYLCGYFELFWRAFSSWSG